MHSMVAMGVRAVLGPVLGTIAAAGLAGCQTGSAFRDPAARLNPDMAAVVAAYQAAGAQPVHTLTVEQARSQPTLADAARTVEQANHAVTRSTLIKTTDLTVPGAAGPLPARLYNPKPRRPHQPVVLFFHGGEWVTGSLDSDDAAAQALAREAHAMVLSIAYRLAPEARFPAAEDDANAAYTWLLDHAATLGADPRRIAVAGESSGGTMAIDVAVAARDAHVKLPVHLLVISPVSGPDLRTRSAIANQRTVPLGRDDLRWAYANTLSAPTDLADPRIDLVGRADLHGLPPTTVISAEMDPLESGGGALTQKLQVSGVDVTRTQYQGTAHGFFGEGAVVARAKEAEAFAATALDETFQRIGDPPPPSVHRATPGHRHAARRHAR